MNVAEMPYERQVDETDDAYGQRLRRRAQVASDIGNQAELLAILTAMQDDLEIPHAGLTIPCETADEWLTVAFLQGVDPDSWETAEPESVGDWDTWFSTELYTDSLRRYIGEKFRYGSMSGLADNTFVGPNGLLYNLHTAQREPNNQLRGLYIELSTHLGYAVADAGDQVPAPTRFANIETLDPPLFGMRGMLWEFESEVAPAEADHGENIVLAQWDPTGRGITGPLNRPSGRPRTTVGAQPGGPRTGVQQGTGRPPRVRGSIPQWLKARFARGRRNEERVRNEEGLTKNNATYGGPSQKTVPDSVTSTHLIEIKDVLVLNLTRQIRNQISAARTGNLSYRIYTGTNTHISRNISQEARSMGVQIEIRRLPYLGRGD
ncbi:MAG: putative toxin [Ascidiaceihabitans sp.]|uniref:putative toxin n=1 Tax=Ascidiaceihabitans sp. TaxID=1872644 RepID=UPI003299A499